MISKLCISETWHTPHSVNPTSQIKVNIMFSKLWYISETWRRRGYNVKGTIFVRGEILRMYDISN